MGQTIVEKILSRIVGKKVYAGDFIFAEPDLVVLYNWPGISDSFFSILKNELQLERIPLSDKTVMFIDHMVSPSNIRDSEFVKYMKKNARDFAIKIVEMQGIGHQVAIESGIIRPGMFVVHFDTHIPTVGAIGAFGVPLALDELEALAAGDVWLEVPSSIDFNISGKLPLGVTGRDLIHKIIYDLGPDGGKQAVMEFSGPGLKHLDVDDRVPVGCQCTWAGSLSTIFDVDCCVEDFLKKFNITSFFAVKRDEDAEYLDKYSYNLQELEPLVVRPPSPFNVTPLSEVEGIEINQGYIGSCASGRLKDIEIAARILKGRKVKNGFKLFVVPSTRGVLAESVRKGLLETLINAGAFISSPTCDYCYGRAQVLASGERIVSTGTLNVPGRMGSPQSEIFLTSSAVVAATALTGKLTDPRKFLPVGDAL
jgi:3-isopropylmalate/(R)-2-methylmalate dehydratase large subunit